MIILLAAGLVGGVTGTALAWSHGILAILLSAPSGASLSVLAAAAIKGYRPVDWVQRKIKAAGQGKATSSSELNGRH